MKLRILTALVMLLSLTPVARAQESIVSGLSTTSVAIDAKFEGASILIYGAATREAPPPDWPLLQVIVTVEGPVQPVTVRRKERVAGIWINQGWVAFDDAPSFYAVMATGALDEVLSQEEDIRYGVSIPRKVGSIRLGAGSGLAAEYLEALQRIRGDNGAYRLAANSVLLLQQSLFRTDVALPANLIEGEYTARIFLTRGGRVVDMQESKITVAKAGLERFLYRMAQDQPLLYGIIALLLAAMAGLGASELFRRLRL